MKVVYFAIPIIAGYYVMQAAIGYSDRNTEPILRERRAAAKRQAETPK